MANTRTVTLTPDDFHTLCHALRVARDVFVGHQSDCLNTIPAMPRIAEQFGHQVDQVNDLLDVLSLATDIVVTTEHGSSRD